jgi:hypothetical protein
MLVQSRLPFLAYAIFGLLLVASAVASEPLKQNPILAIASGVQEHAAVQPAPSADAAKASDHGADNIWPIVLSSSVISGVLGALISGWLTLRGKRNDYADAYYKMVLERRLEAQNEVEGLITLLKVAVHDDTDGRLYHMLFSKDDDRETVYKLLYDVLSKALWLSDDLFQLTRELNILIFSQTNDVGLIEFGKKHYKQIAELRTKMEILHARDMLSLHRIPEFLRKKKPSDTYTPLPNPAKRPSTASSVNENRPGTLESGRPT